MWTFLRNLITEFAPTHGKAAGTFDEGIFSHPIPQAERVASPLNTSPRGGHSELPAANSRSASPVTAISLDRVEPGVNGDSDSVEELVDPLPSDTGASAPSAGAFGASVSRSNKIMSFAPPDTRRLSEARTSISTVVPHRISVATVISPTPRLTVSQPPSSVPSSLPTRVSTPSTQDRKSRSRKLQTTVASDYPDPYGINYQYSTPSQATSSRITTREPSPARRTEARLAGQTGKDKENEQERQKEHEEGVIQLTMTSTRSTRHNSRDKAKDSSHTPQAASSGPSRSSTGAHPSRTQTVDDQRRKSSGSGGRQSAAPPSGRIGSPVARTKVDQSAQGDNAAKKEVRVYREERCRPLMHWWRATIDQVSSVLFHCTGLVKACRLSSGIG